MRSVSEISPTQQHVVQLTMIACVEQPGAARCVCVCLWERGARGCLVHPSELGLPVVHDVPQHVSCAAAGVWWRWYGCCIKHVARHHLHLRQQLRVAAAPELLQQVETDSNIRGVSAGTHSALAKEQKPMLRLHTP